MGLVRDLAEKLWTGEVSTVTHHPFTPLLAWEEVGARAAFVSSFANALALDTDEGVVLVDTGSFLLASQVHDAVRKFTPRPLNTAIYTHGHVDHVGGVAPFEAEAGAARARVIAHDALPARFDRYKLTRGYQSCINSRQFGLDVQFPVDYRYPDETFPATRRIEVGGVRLDLAHARGETDDHVWAWIPSLKLLYTGDLFIWAAPNAGNPQKVQRYPREWAAALREMSHLGAETLCPGHGPPIFGAARVAQALGETAELLESLVAQTIALLNEGARLDRVLTEVRAPAHLLERPYLRPIYDEPAFVVRNIWRLYGGWWDGNPAHLKPAPDAAVAGELATLAGGAHKLCDRAVALAAEGGLEMLTLACHLIELASQAAPADEAIRAARGDLYRRRAELESSLMAKGIFRAAAAAKI